eukprot:Phypoly_transcript_09991.p1 GENE.Phypoly_transcript_09991~~Phypoly_transcript_09991.p1  ORF type:complete len:133 (+),score=12.41 Phypoly_transcript_09991:410-808(+)
MMAVTCMLMEDSLLTTGYDIVLEYMDETKGAAVVLSWSSACQPKQYGIVLVYVYQTTGATALYCALLAKTTKLFPHHNFTPATHLKTLMEMDFLGHIIPIKIFKLFTPSKSIQMYEFFCTFFFVLFLILLRF